MMSMNDFIRGYLGMMKEPNYNEDTVKLLGGCADTTKDG